MNKKYFPFAASLLTAGYLFYSYLTGVMSEVTQFYFIAIFVAEFLAFKTVNSSSKQNMGAEEKRKLVRLAKILFSLQAFVILLLIIALGADESFLIINMAIVFMLAIYNSAQKYRHTGGSKMSNYKIFRPFLLAVPIAFALDAVLRIAGIADYETKNLYYVFILVAAVKELIESYYKLRVL